MKNLLKIFILTLFLSGCATFLPSFPVFAQDVYYPNLGQIYEQAERAKQMQLQNQMLQMQIDEKNREQYNEDVSQNAFKRGYDSGYKQGFEMAMSFNQLPIKELEAMKENISSKYSPVSDTYKQLMPLLEWRINQLKSLKCSENPILKELP